jgi:hypothetical protein
MEKITCVWCGERYSKALFRHRSLIPPRFEQSSTRRLLKQRTCIFCEKCSVVKGGRGTHKIKDTRNVADDNDLGWDFGGD